MMDVDIPVYRDVSRLFNFMYYTGASIFVRPCSTEIRRSPWVRVLRAFQCCICFFVFLLLLGIAVFEIQQFMLLIWKMKNIGEIIPNIIWLTSFPLAIMAQVFYTVKGSILLRYFQRWQQIRQEFSHENEEERRERTKPLRFRMYCIYLLAVCSSVAMVIVVILDFPVLPFLPSMIDNGDDCCNSLLSPAYLPLVCSVFAIGVFYAWNLSAASDLVPSMIYYHLADEIDNINRLIPCAEPCDMRKMWLNYEAIRGLIDEANLLFGSMLVLNHGAMFFVASSNVFAIMRWYQGMSWLLLLVNGLNAGNTILRVTTTILLCSRLSNANGRLQAKISRHLAFHLDAPFVSTAFLIRIQDNGIIASPLHLYSIKPSILLTLLSLLVTYLIVLLQSSSKSSFAGYANFTGLITNTLFYNLAT